MADKQNNGNHAAPPAQPTEAQIRAVDAACHKHWPDARKMAVAMYQAVAPETAQERGRLRAINAELVEALERIAFRPDFEVYETFGGFVQSIARAALKRAKEE